MSDAGAPPDKSEGGFELGGEAAKARELVRRTRRACGPPDRVKLKVILETAALRESLGLKAVEDAARLAVEEGADFLKTSTGKYGGGGADLESVDVLARVARECTTRVVGVKVSGGVRTAEQAFQYAAVCAKHGLPIAPDTFRIGASALLQDLQRAAGLSAADGNAVRASSAAKY